MAKNTRTYWYNYEDIDKILKSKNNNDFLYYVEDTASQNSEQALQRIDNSFAILEANPELEATVIPINLGHIDRGVYEGSHWVGIVIRRNQETRNLEAFYNDSLGTSMDISLPNLRMILKNHGIPDERIIDFKHIQQNNGYDCGAWTVLNLDSLARTGKLSEATENDVIYQRKEVFGYTHVKISSIEKGRIQIKGQEDYKSYSELGDEDKSVDVDTPYLSTQLEKLKINDQSHIKFILNVPMYVSSANIDELSSPDTTDDETFEEDLFNFDVNDKSSLPFRTFDINDTVRISQSKKTPGKEIIKHRTGSLESDDSENRDELFVQGNKSEEYSRAHKLLELLEKGGFDEADKDYIGNIGVSIGLNRPYSLSSRKNSFLEKELHRNEKTIIKYKKAAFFWDVLWTNKAGDKKEHDDVQKFYRQLKRKDPAKAKKFLEINEELELPSPPYQYIREYIKNHKNTKELIQSLRTDDTVIYFSSIDSDTKHFNGIYSSYLKIIAKAKKLPTVMSTGYEFSEEKEGVDYPFVIASRVDRMVRVETAKYVPLGVYYPEPNMCILIPDNNDTISESFISTVSSERQKQKLESAIILRQVAGRADFIAIFSGDNPIITTIPERVRADGGKFSEQFKRNHIPTIEDKKALAAIAQSHLDPWQWAINLYMHRSFELLNPDDERGVYGKYRGSMKEVSPFYNPAKIYPKLSKYLSVGTIIKFVKAAYDIQQKVLVDTLKLITGFEVKSLYEQLAVEAKENIGHVRLILPECCDINLLYKGYAPIHTTLHLYTKNRELLFFLLEECMADPNVQDKRGDTLAHYTVEENDIELLKLLHSKGANFNITNCAGSTALEHTAEHYQFHHEAYEFLLQNTDTSIVEKIILAIKHQDLGKLIHYLNNLENRAEILNTETKKHELIGHVACATGNLKIINLLEKNCCNLGLISSNSTTALEEACYGDNADLLNPQDRIALIRKLIEQNKISITDTAIHNSLYCNDLSILELLLNKGGSPNALCSVGFTPLLVIINQPQVTEKDLETLKLLLQHGADILLTEGHVGNALHLASERGHMEVVNLLLEHAKKTNQLEQLLQPSSPRMLGVFRLNCSPDCHKIQ